MLQMQEDIENVETEEEMTEYIKRFDKLEDELKQFGKQLVGEGMEGVFYYSLFVYYRGFFLNVFTMEVDGVIIAILFGCVTVETLIVGQT